MRAHVALSPAAVRDVEACAAFIARENSKAAEQFVGDFQDILARIATLPESFRRQHLIDTLEFSNVRVTRVSARFSRYLVFLEQSDTESYVVLRMLHGRRDVPKAFELE